MDLEKDSSNLAVASGTSVKDFAAEYKNLELQLADIRRLLTASNSDSDVKKLNEMLSSIQ